MTCVVCGTPARPPFRAPTAEQAPDLDHRPGEPARSTLVHWIATCRQCGASGPDLAALPEGAEAVVRSDEYRRMRPRGLGTAFLRWALICERTGDRAAAAEATLHAAWATDDEGGDGADLRRRAVELWGEPAGIAAVLRQVDVLRRAGEFAQAGALADRFGAGVLDENDAAVLAFQRGRIAAADAGRHSIASALRPPARRPHVTHGRPTGSTKGFWSRLFGS